ncbi:MAG: DUF4385 domain-containing protein [Pleurocapsa sp. SU_196_0]|nr:DUF4385 domain-containing protein [Pleurocapsa sp. SU_196_0]
MGATSFGVQTSISSLEHNDPVGKTSAIYTDEYRRTDFRLEPEKYRVGVGEQGVLIVEPYKSELLALWRFRTPEIATESANALLERFRAYRDAGDFVGMDMARKYLQMGWTRSRRYANHRSGQKYEGAVPADKKGQSGAHGRLKRPLEPDEVKARSAAIFRAALDEALADELYQRALEEHRAVVKKT